LGFKTGGWTGRIQCAVEGQRALEEHKPGKAEGGGATAKTISTGLRDYLLRGGGNHTTLKNRPVNVRTASTELGTKKSGVERGQRLTPTIRSTQERRGGSRSVTGGGPESRIIQSDDQEPSRGEGYRNRYLIAKGTSQ